MAAGQRISTAKIGDSRYFISWQNPYAPRLNFYLAYQYCRTIAMELISLETAEEAQNISDYLRQGNFDNNQSNQHPIKPQLKMNYRLTLMNYELTMCNNDQQGKRGERAQEFTK